MLVAVSACHGRHALTRAWAEHTASLGFDGVVLAVTIGDRENIEACHDNGLIPIECLNSPLSGKFNAALSQASQYIASPKWERIMILPSDDFASPAWVKAAREEEGDYLYPHTCATVCSETQRAYYIQPNKLTFGTLKFGAGRVVSRKVIERLGGQLWPENLDRGLDTASHNAITRAGFKHRIVQTEGIPITDVKTKENIWSFRTWENSGRPIGIDEALHMVSPSVRAQIDALKTA